MNVAPILLDGAQGLIIFPVYFIARVIGTMLIEGTMLHVFKYEKWLLCITTALVANLLSFAVGLIVIMVTNYLNIRDLPVLLTIFYIETVIVEFIYLRKKNGDYRLGKLVIVTLLMNLLTYIPLYFILER